MKRAPLLLVTWLAILLPEISLAADRTPPAVIPRVTRFDVVEGACPLGPDLAIWIDGPRNADVRLAVETLAPLLRAQTGLALPINEGDPQRQAAILVRMLPGGDTAAPLARERYVLDITPQQVRIGATTASGVRNALQTLRQLIPPRGASSAPSAPRAIPCTSIIDEPRYRWRGMLLDCSRHFMPVEQVKRTVDLLAYHKLNVLHWHVTDDQGWRVEIRKYPKLTEVGAWRRATRDSEQPRDAQGRYGGFYSQDEIRDVVAYAAARGIAVVPEIELPGHAVAALAAFPQLACTGGPFEVSTKWGVHEDVFCAGNDEVFTFIEDVLSEVTALFPSEYIHIGGDEVPKVRWQACPRCQARMRAENLKNEAELQSWFIRRVEQLLSARGRKLIGWDEILEGGLAPNATVQSWRGLAGALAAARAGHDVICSPTSHCYLDYPQANWETDYGWMGRITLEKAYGFQPAPAELTPEQVKHVLGLECNLWTEQVPPARVDWQLFPRLCALAEVGWSAPATRDWADLERRLAAHLPRLDALGVKYFKPPTTVQPASRPDDWWKQRFALLDERCRAGGAALLFIGDSITQGWEDAGREAWEREFAPRHAINLGISGDRTQHVLWRLQNGHLDGLATTRPATSPPRVAVVMIGTNNTPVETDTPADIASGVAAIVYELRHRLPDVQVLLLAVFPRATPDSPLRAKIAAVNDRLQHQVANGKTVHYLDIGVRFLAPDGTLPPEIMPDQLHLSPRGYELWAEAIRAEVERLASLPPTTAPAP